MKKTIILLLISAPLFATNSSFVTSGKIKLPSNNFLISNEAKRAQNSSALKAKDICKSDIEQVSKWEMTIVKESRGRIFGEASKQIKYVLAKAAFICL